MILPMSRPPPLAGQPAPVPRRNRLLAALPRREFERLQPALELVWLPPGKVLHESGETPSHVYFPTTCLVSLICAMEDGSGAGISVVGDDGMIGIALFTGGESMPERAVALTEGYAWRLHRIVLRHEESRIGGRRASSLHRLLLCYTQALATQIAQTAVCYRRHSVAQQVSRWLLMCGDRTASNDLRMTQELIAHMLGVRREGVTEAAGRLQAQGIIRYARGRITILDRVALEAHACECYGVIRGEYKRLLSLAELG